MTKRLLRFSLFNFAVLVSLVVFITDALTPVGIEIWVFYLPVILSLVFSNSTRLIAFMAATCTVLVLAGRFLSPAGYSPDWWDILNRAMGIMSIWLTAGAGIALCTRSQQISKLNKELLLEVESRKQVEQLLRASEERMRLAMESGGLGTRDVNLENKQEIWSETHFRICGYKPVSGGSAVGEMLDSLIHQDDFERILEARQQARKDRSLYHVEYRLRRADTQKIVWIEVWGRYHYDQMGKAVRFIGICFDISRRKELERKELEREVLEITTKQQQLIGQDLHDGLGQELTGLGLMAQTLAQRMPEASLESRIASRLISGLDHAHRIIRELSRGLMATEVDCKGLIPALKELAKSTAELTGISVIVDCPESIEMPDHTSATHMYRIAQEAVSNALRHGQPRQIRLALHSEPGCLSLNIKDDGIGLLLRAEESQGLGLRIMKYRAGLLGGSLQIGSVEEESGTIVTLTLPERNSDDSHSTES